MKGSKRKKVNSQIFEKAANIWRSENPHDMQTNKLMISSFLFQSMELLILSKLQWDLTAITAYDYIDHILESINQKWRSSQAGNSSGSNFIDPRNYETLRR